MTKVSRRHGISDVALAKICRRLNIPVPERGYWARVAAGQKLSQPPLPPRGPGVPQTVQTDPGRGRTWASELKTAELTPAPVSEVLSSPHRLTLDLQKSFSLRISDFYGRVGSSREAIDAKVAPSSISRVLLFVDAFVKAAEDRGYPWRLPERYAQFVHLRWNIVTLRGNSMLALSNAVMRCLPTGAPRSQRSECSQM